MGQLLTYLVGVLAGKTFIRIFIFSALYLVMQQLYSIVQNFISSAYVFGSVSSLSGLPSFFGYLFQYLQIPTGMQMISSAFATRFAIRRLPVVG